MPIWPLAGRGLHMRVVSYPAKFGLTLVRIFLNMSNHATCSYFKQWQWAFFAPSCSLGCLGLALVHFRSNPTFAGKYESCMEAASQIGFTSIGSPDWPRTPTQGFKTTIAPAFLNPQKSHQPTLQHKITQEPIL